MKRSVVDPIPKYGGRPMTGTAALIVALVALIGGAASLLIGSNSDGYDEVERLASIKCLGCLGLDPVVPGFSDFWVDYPSDHVRSGESVPHPEPVVEILADEEIDFLILFFWGPGCVPCDRQWEEMVDEDIASGPEEGGREGKGYQRMKLISVDSTHDPNGLYRTYLPKGTENGVPMTTFMFTDGDGAINWWSHYGRMEIEDLLEMIETIKAIMKTVNYEHISHS